MSDQKDLHMSEGNGKVLDKMAPVRGTRTTLDRLDSAQEELRDAAKLLYAGDQAGIPAADRALKVVAGIVTELRVTCLDTKKGPLADPAGGDCVMDKARLG